MANITRKLELANNQIINDIKKQEENLIKLVLDIEKYPAFVPWCTKGKVYENNDKGDVIEIVADLTITKFFLM